MHDSDLHSIPDPGSTSALRSDTEQTCCLAHRRRRARRPRSSSRPRTDPQVERTCSTACDSFSRPSTSRSGQARALPFLASHSQCPAKGFCRSRRASRSSWARSGARVGRQYGRQAGRGAGPTAARVQRRARPDPTRRRAAGGQRIRPRPNRSRATGATRPTRRPRPRPVRDVCGRRRPCKAVRRVSHAAARDPGGIRQRRRRATDARSGATRL